VALPVRRQDMFRVLGEVNAEIDTMLLGRVTYEVFAESFADAPADDPVAAELTRPAKVVVSSTIGEPRWAKTTVLRGDVVTGVRALKDQPGSAILVNGSISLARTLLRAGLVDELHLLIHPTVVGRGERLFEADGPQIPLEVASSEVLSRGVLSVRYRTDIH